MDRIVRKEVGVDGDRARLLVGDAVLQAQRELFFQQLDALPFDREPPVRADLNAWLQQPADPLALALDETIVEQTLDRLNAKVVRDVDDVDDQRAVDAAVPKDDVEIAEGCGMRGRPDAAGHKNGRRHENPQLHGSGNSRLNPAGSDGSEGSEGSESEPFPERVVLVDQERMFAGDPG